MFPMRAVKHWTRWTEGASIGDIARLVEDAGFDAFSMSEHPYPDKEWLANGGHHAFDPFVSLSFAAAATTRIRLMTYLLVSGYRSPFVTAKAAASFDLLSGGRFTLGTGAGYLKSEFEALGADFDHRGALLDEAIAAWKATWAGVDHDGPAFGVSGHLALPPPLTTGGPPVWIGGNGKAAQRRVVEVADGWMPMAASGEMAAITRARPLEDVATLGEWITAINKRRADVGREPADVAFVPFEAEVLASGDCSGFTAAVQPRLEAYADAGVTWITVEPASRSFTDFRTDVDVLASQLVHR
ncbi:TIGR03619 family F420-dependent LLM class oxidoreductase [Mycolicibacterium sp.]|uniref:TIGR03619 family F420-dependent LLM class oxidoreductase n=1 Tax=Mycolicibacterium sp. TaxID=2320850 RepID=UPI001A2888D6|nr:TIGR03619 family F420-dependent LLM class oxidoreductase [Mycolicibacterium sp.]MBJ7336479.1 TIGR03619 family F420-dependent LLM class oxidoreductase [Mycolicibacterium sp.]